MFPGSAGSNLGSPVDPPSGQPTVAQASPPRPPAQKPSGRRPRRFVWRLRDLQVRTKLFAGLAVPTAAFLALAVLSGVTWYDNADSYGRDVSVAELGRHVTAAVHELQGERDLSA
nr:hypothetical protein [Micromonospora sp. DSM 115978]